MPVEGSFTSSFATRELNKHGWNAGKGLGRLENGMKDAIKVKIKNNKGGLGHDHGSEFTFHWWDHIFNKTANSIKVSSDDDGVRIEKDETTKKIQPMLISTKKPLRTSIAGKPLLYGTFVKSGTFHNDEETKEPTEDSSESSSNEEDFSAKDTLERTFKMTGLTGHKAARHGHRLSGKLQRVKDQENGATNKINNKSEQLDIERQTNECSDINLMGKKKKKRKKDLEEEGTFEDCSSVPKKRKKKKKRNSKDNLIETDLTCNSEKTRKKKKKKKSGLK